jgi:dienelactone hydrolase
VAFFFGEGDRALFGAYDAPEGAPRGAVLLVNPVGDDALRAHRPLRHLKARLVEAGFAVLRFDFHGTGDSHGDERDPDRVRTWLCDIGLALAELRRRSGATSVDVVGLRLGATLALAAAATDDDIDGVVAWGPYACGADFHRDATRLFKLHRMLEPAGFSGGPSSRPDGEEAFGFLLTHETIAQLSTLDVRALGRAPAKRVLVLGDGSNARGEEEICARLTTLGVATERRVVPRSMQALVDIPHKARLPEEAIGTTVTWLCTGRRDASAREKPVCYGRRRGFGILHMPRRPSSLPPIVLTSAGAVHRVGPHRLYVKLARRFAALGFTVLRVDLSGIGDSPPGADGVENVTYPRDGYDDLREAMDWIGERTDQQRLILAGLCSGGDFAFQMALRDERVRGALILNPRTFCVLSLAEVETGNNELVIAAAERARSGATPVPVSLRRMVERGVETLLVVSENDPGVHHVDTTSGDAMRALRELPGFHREDVPGADHNFTSLWAQETVVDLCARHLQGRYLQCDTQDGRRSHLASP